jgi:hypothetical protein
MPVQIVWENQERTIIRQIFHGETCLEDYFYATDATVRLAKQVAHPLHVIMDRTAVSATPPLLWSAIRYAQQRRPPHIRLGVMVGACVVTRFLLPCLLWWDADTTPLLFAEELLEARQLIERYPARQTQLS